MFADGFDLAAATHISGGAADEYEVLDLLDSLVRKSLISTERISGHHLRSELGEPAFDRLVARGEAMGFGDAMQYARSQVQGALDQLASQTP